MSERTVDQVASEIERSRTELAAAVATVRQDLRGMVLEQVPRVAAAVGLVVGVLAARKVVHGRRRRKQAAQTEVLRLGRFALVERS